MPPAPVGQAPPVPQAGNVAGLTGGEPLSPAVGEAIERSLHVGLPPVRVHTDTRAQQMARGLAARAVTYGHHIFLGPNERPTDVALMAHEVAHVIQQEGPPKLQLFGHDQADPCEREAHQAAAAVVRGESFTPRERTSGRRIQRLGLSDALDYFADQANMIPGFRMFTIILGMNPINMSPVDASAANIIRALIEFLPGGGLITQALDNSGVFEKVGAWVKQQIDTLGMTGGAIKKAITDFLGTLSLSDISNLGDVWERAKRIFTEPIDRIINFAKGLITGIIQFVKDAILIPIAKLAQGTPSYDLLKAVLGEDPITGEKVPQTAETIIGPFMKLIGQEDVWQNMQKANAIPRAFAWFKGAMSAVVGFVRQIPTLFVNAFKALTLEDIILVPTAFAKLVGVFGGFVGQFISWAGNAVWNLLQIIFDVVSPGAWGYIQKTGAALKSILKNPIPFVGNLVKAAKLGFLNFADHFGTHLKAGLIDWLTGSLPGVYIPKAFTLGEIVKFVFSVLGLTWQNVRAKLVKVVGETAVKAMETGFDIVMTLVTQGPAAAWDKIKDQLANLKDMVIGGITDFVVDMVVQKAVPKLVAMFIPGAGFISAILSIYDTIMVFVHKISKIIQVVTAFIDSIVAIAGGAIEAAASRVESILAGLLSLAINFLAGFAGLGKVADKIMGVINKVRAPIDKALDWLIGWIVKTAKTLFAKVFGKKDKEGKTDERTDAQKKVDVHKAAVEADELMKHADASPRVVKDKLLGIRAKYKLTGIELVQDDRTRYRVKASINPDEYSPEEELGPDDDTIPEPIWEEAVLGLKPGEYETKLSPDSAQFNTTVLRDYISRAPASVTEKARAQATMTSKMDAALAATDGDKIYVLLAQATRAVTQLYPEGAISLQVHHAETVSENPATFTKTRAQRARPKINAKVKKLTKKEQAKVVGRPDVVRLWIQQMIDEDTTQRPQKLTTVNMIVLTREAHIGETGVHQQP